MSWILPLMGASGMLLFITGLPNARRRALAMRVDPYVSGLRGRPSALLKRSLDPTQPLLRSLGRRLAPWLRQDRDLVDRLRAAGDERAPEVFRVEQFLWASIGGSMAIAGFVLLTTITGGADLRALPFLVAIGSMTGFLGRDWLLQQRARNRRDRLDEQLPVAVDLIALAVMAGESIPAAFERIAASMPGGLGAELQRVVADVRAGEPLSDSLESFARRSDDAATLRLVDALCTGIERGAPLAEVLRAHAEDARDARRKRLIEIAGRREVLMLVPVVFLIMPVVVVFALYPGLVSLRLLVP